MQSQSNQAFPVAELIPTWALAVTSESSLRLQRDATATRDDRRQRQGTAGNKKYDSRAQMAASRAPLALIAAAVTFCRASCTLLRI